jgi:hypothetical protein
VISVAEMQSTGGSAFVGSYHSSLVKVIGIQDE